MNGRGFCLVLEMKDELEFGLLFYI